MSLSVYLQGPPRKEVSTCHHCGSKYEAEEREEFFHRNITHNLARMAEEAGIYKHLWRPSDLGITKAAQLIDPLREGLQTLIDDPERFRAFDPPNKWGDYGALVAFVRAYLDACEETPEAEVYASI